MQPTAEPRREVTDDEIEAFWRDGVVCLRDIMPTEWLDFMAEPVETSLRSPAVANLSEMSDALAGSARPDAPRGQFFAGTDHSRTQPEFYAFSAESPLVAIVAQLLRSQRVWLYEDSVLVKEPGTAEKTVFHQDMAYFHLDGDQVCTTWVPLDPVDARSGAVRFVRGSHTRETRLRPNLFVTSEPIPGTVGDIVPDFSGSADLVSFDTEPGDITVHHARTIHGAYANESATRRRRAISVRYAGDDVVYRIKPGAPRKPHHADLVEGRPLDPPACPQVWPVTQ